MVQESLDRLGRAWQFTQLDLINSYYWMKIKKGNELKTIFRTRYGHFKYQVISFKLTNASATFQDYINKILVEKLDVFVFIYLNDILIYIESKREEYMEAVW